MVGGFLRTLVAVALLPWHVVPPSIGREHRHAPDAGHHEPVVHRHVQAHHDDDVDGDDHHEPALDHDDVLWLDNAVVAQAQFTLHASPAALASTFTLTTPFGERSGFVEFSTAPAHGPPRSSSSLRGPPHLSS